MRRDQMARGLTSLGNCGMMGNRLGQKMHRGNSLMMKSSKAALSFGRKPVALGRVEGLGTGEAKAYEPMARVRDTLPEAKPDQVREIEDWLDLTK